MLTQIGSMFDDYEKKLVFSSGKRAAYDKFLTEFREENVHFLREMTGLVEKSDEKERTADEIAKTLVDAVRTKYQKWGRISGRRKADLSFYMIYYVFPSILLTEHPDAAMLCDHIRDTWNAELKERVTYTTYEEIRSSFHEKILGLIQLPDQDD